MKKNVILVIISIVLTACSAQPPQVTVTLPPSTDTPIPTPTLHPQFSALQDLVANEESDKYSLPSAEDGLLFDGQPTGVDVDKNGVISINVNGETVIIDPATVHFGVDGLQIDGYDLDETGAWGLAAETTTINGYEVELGAAFENGDVAVVKINAPEGMSADKVEAFNKKVDIKLLAISLGFGEGNIEWRVRTGEDGAPRLVIVNPADPSVEIAEMGNGEVVWDWNMMVDENGENVLLKVGKLVPARGGVPVDRNAQSSSDARLANVVKDMHPAYYKGISAHLVLAKDGSTGLLVIKLLGKEEYETGKIETSGFIYFWDKDGKAISVFVENFSLRRV